jgi:hypothetical protein
MYELRRSIKYNFLVYLHTKVLYISTFSRSLIQRTLIRRHKQHGGTIKEISGYANTIMKLF